MGDGVRLAAFIGLGLRWIGLDWAVRCGAGVRRASEAAARRVRLGWAGQSRGKGKGAVSRLGRGRS